jgi:hypothetical protein
MMYVMYVVCILVLVDNSTISILTGILNFEQGFMFRCFKGFNCNILYFSAKVGREGSFLAIFSVNVVAFVQMNN